MSRLNRILFLFEEYLRLIKEYGTSAPLKDSDVPTFTRCKPCLLFVDTKAYSKLG